MKISARPFLKELLENECLNVVYNEYANGFDLSVRINEEKVKELENQMKEEFKYGK